MRIDRFYLIPELIAVLVIVPIVWSASDWEPPQTRISGSVVSQVNPSRPPRIGEAFSPIWSTTPHIKDCPGQVQVEIFDADNEVHIEPSRPPFNPRLGSKTLKPPEPWKIPNDFPAGPAVYRVTTVWYCTWWQRFWHRPVIQVGPDIDFTILPKG